MKKWYFYIEHFKAEPGFEFQFNGSGDDKRYLHLCEIMLVEKGRKLSYSWKYKDYPGESILTFELLKKATKQG